MRTRRWIAIVLLLLGLVATSPPAWAIFGIPSAEDLLIWLVLRPWMHRNQDTQIANQVRELREMVTALQTATGQLAQVRNMAQGQIGAIAAPITDQVAVPSDLLDQARDWQDDFTGRAGRMAGTLNDFRDGTPINESWRDMLAAADTVREADIRATYAGGPKAADRAVAAFGARREAADRRLERTAARAAAAADVQALRAATAGTLETVADRIDSDPGTGAANLSGTALEEGTAIARIAQLRMLIGMGRNRAVSSQARAADASTDEVARRELEAGSLDARMARTAEWAAGRAAMEASREARLSALYGGFRLHPFFGGEND